jgi:hypothetical protein
MCPCTSKLSSLLPVAYAHSHCCATHGGVAAGPQQRVPPDHGVRGFAGRLSVDREPPQQVAAKRGVATQRRQVVANGMDPKYAILPPNCRLPPRKTADSR